MRPYETAVELLTPAAILDNHRLHEQLRAEGPVLWSVELEAWVTPRYEQASEVLANNSVYGNDLRRLGMEVPAAGDTIQMVDPPQHGAFRTALMHSVHDARWHRIRDGLGAQFASHLEEVEGSTVDFVAQIAEPIALRNALDLTGLPDPDHEWFLGVSRRIVDAMDAAPDSEVAHLGLRARDELTSWILEASTGAPTSLVAKIGEQTAGEPVRRVANTVRVALHAAFESVSRTLALVCHELAADPDLHARTLSADLDAASEELIRFVSPVQGETRICVQTHTLSGVEIAAGESVVALIGSANFDETVFPRPGYADLDRSPNRHLAFGRGVHACAGTHVAKASVRAMLDELSTRTVHLVDSTATPNLRGNATLRGLADLRVAISPVEGGTQSAPAGRLHATAT